MNPKTKNKTLSLCLAFTLMFGSVSFVLPPQDVLADHYQLVTLTNPETGEIIFQEYIPKSEPSTSEQSTDEESLTLSNLEKSIESENSDIEISEQSVIDEQTLILSSLENFANSEQSNPPQSDDFVTTINKALTGIFDSINSVFSFPQAFAVPSVTIFSPTPFEIITRDTPTFIWSIISPADEITRIFATVDGIPVLDNSFPGGSPFGNANFAVDSPVPLNDGAHSFSLLVESPTAGNIFQVNGFFVGTPTNGVIAFASNRDGSLQTYTMNPDGTGLDQLTFATSGGNNFEPNWSHDGTQIVFRSDRDGNQEIYTMNADGSDQTRITFAGTFDNTPSFSPDGTQITWNRGNEVHKMNSDGSVIFQLTDGPSTALNFDPSWSGGAGTKIAFSSNRDGSDFEIYSMNTDGSSQTRLTNRVGVEASPNFSYDGTKITFISRFGFSNDEVFIMNADGTGKINISNDASASDSNPAWSPDATEIVFRKTGDIYTMNVDGSDQTNITNIGGDDTQPSWQPIPAKIWLGGASTNWSNPSNWSDGTLPAGNEKIIIDGGVTVNLDFIFALTTGTLIVGSELFPTTELVIGATGSLINNSTNTVTINGLVTVNNGRTLTNSATGTIIITSSGRLVNSGTILNSGTITISNSASATSAPSPTIPEDKSQYQTPVAPASPTPAPSPTIPEDKSQYQTPPAPASPTPAPSPTLEQSQYQAPSASTTPAAAPSPTIPEDKSQYQTPAAPA